MRNRLLSLTVLVLGLVGLIGAGLALAGEPAERPYRAYLPALSRASLDPTPTPTPRPSPFQGPIESISLGTARIFGNDPMEVGDTVFIGGREFLQDPTAPQYIMTYPRFGKPGYAAGNTLFAAHVNYVRYGNGPFAYLTDAAVGDALYVKMVNGPTYTYTVKSVEVVSLAVLDMDAVVYPPLDSYTERITLISCGGTFIPAAIGGEYTSRVILVAEAFRP